MSRDSTACIDLRSLSLNTSHARLQVEPLRAMAKAALKRLEPVNQALNAHVAVRSVTARQRTEFNQPYKVVAILIETFRNRPPDLTKSY